MPSLSRRAVLAGVCALVPTPPAVAQSGLIRGMSQVYPNVPDALLAQWRERLLGLAFGYRGQTVGRGYSTEFVIAVFRQPGFQASEARLEGAANGRARCCPGS